MTQRKPLKPSDLNRAKLIGLRIKSLREQKGYTQLEIGRKVGVTPGAIGQYETARHLPRVRILERIAMEFDVKLEWLMTGEDPEEQIKAQTTTEKEALKLIRAIPTKDHEALLAMLQGLAKPAK
jgi:transcriptional regulator with XRE-family HTH domain